MLRLFLHDRLRPLFVLFSVEGTAAVLVPTPGVSV